MPVASAAWLRVTTAAALATSSPGDGRATPLLPVSTLMALTQAGRDTGNADRVDTELDPPYEQMVNNGGQVYRYRLTRRRTWVAALRRAAAGQDLGQPRPGQG